MKAYALLLRRKTDELQLAAWEVGFSNPELFQHLEDEYKVYMERVQKRLHREYGLDDQTFIALKEQAMTM